MKRFIVTAALAACMAVSVSAAEPATLTDRADRLDEVIFGSVQTGSFLDRVGSMDKEIYGAENAGGSLDARVSDLYRDVVRDGDAKNPSLSTRVNTLEYYLTDEIRQDSLGSRVEALESTVFGAARTGALDLRIGELEKAVYGDTHFELVPVVLPANTVFKISLNEEVSSKTNLEGDEVHFTVQEDVKEGDVLVLPRGAQGSGVITKVSRPKMFGRSGELEISFNQVFSIDEEEIPTVLGPEAREKLKMEAAAVGASAIGALALGPIGLVGGLFVKGKDVNMPAGTELYIQTQADVNTRGMQQAPGAPKPILRRVKAAGKTAEVTTAKTVEKSAAAPAEAVKTAPEAAKTEEKAALPAAAEGTEETDGPDEDPSVVIVRHE